MCHIYVINYRTAFPLYLVDFHLLQIPLQNYAFVCFCFVFVFDFVFVFVFFFYWNNLELHTEKNHF